MPDPTLNDEEGRLAALAGYGIMDTEPEARYEKITALIKLLLDVPMVSVSLVDMHRQWFKSRQGLPMSETPRDVSFCNHAIRSRKPLLVPDAQRDPRFRSNPLVSGPPSIRSYAGVPLKTPEGYNIGTLCVMDTSTRSLSAGQIEILENFACLVMDEMELRRVAQSDSLTGAMTRRAFTAECDKAIAWFRTHARPSALVVMDLDDFKSVNQDHGRAAGDQVLRKVAEICTISIREKDYFGRIEGEEFAFMLNDTTLPEAMAASERFRARIAAMEVEVEGVAAPIKVTASFGVAPLQTSTFGFDAWIQAADVGLHRAREAGGNACFPGILDE